MKRIFVFSCTIIILCICLTSLVYSQSLDQIKAEAREQARREMGVDQPKQYVREMPERKSASNPISKLTVLQQAALIGIIIAFIPATIAKVKGRSFIAWWVLGLVCFIVVFPISVYMKKLPEVVKTG